MNRIDRKQGIGRCKRVYRSFLAGTAVCLSLTACGSGIDKIGEDDAAKQEGAGNTTEQEAEMSNTTGQTLETEAAAVGISYETAADGSVDFAVLQEENPDIFAWLYVPGTGIDCPVVQSGIADDFYETHDAAGKENEDGAVYTEMANLVDMTDFNTVLHGKAVEGNGNFADLYQYMDSDFFEKNDKIYIFLDGNLLGYEIFAAYEREDDSLIRRYNFTSAEGCNDFLADLYTREMGKQIREGWDGLTCNHFLITLTTKVKEDDERQFVVIGALIEDEAGTLNRAVMN